MRKLIAIAAGVVILLLVNFTIYQREQLLKTGRIVLLELAPVDPRSLMQGDYMALRFALASAAFAQAHNPASDGHIVVVLDNNNVAHFQRLGDEAPLAANEVALRYRIRDHRLKFASNAFFFEEGQAREYEKARYGEFRVAANGEMLLAAMRDANHQRLGAKP